MSRKGENIYKRKDGRWEARCILGRLPDGKPKYRSVYGRSYTEARTKQRQYITTRQPVHSARRLNFGITLRSGSRRRS